MTLTFTIPGEPVGVNRSFVGGKRPFVKAPAARLFAARIAMAGRAARMKAKCETSEAPCEVWITLYFGSDRPDTDGPVKPILDALQKPMRGRPGAGIYANDRQVVAYHVTRNIDRERPRVEVVVHEVEAWASVAVTSGAKRRGDGG